MSPYIIIICVGLIGGAVGYVTMPRNQMVGVIGGVVVGAGVGFIAELARELSRPNVTREERERSIRFLAK
jgi:uncharacterized membrane protein YeaQ/YmgE (transglycosylase-associated protein family)